MFRLIDCFLLSSFKPPPQPHKKIKQSSSPKSTDIAAASKIDHRSGPALAGTCADAGDALYCHFQVNLAFVGAVILCSRHYENSRSK